VEFVDLGITRETREREREKSTDKFEKGIFDFRFAFVNAVVPSSTGATRVLLVVSPPHATPGRRPLRCAPARL
jgi:hypothetical protein